MNNKTSPRPGTLRFWLVIYAIIFVFAGILAIETALRIRFPWDLYFWPESPFLTNLMKLDLHQPVYTDPADGNSFVYSPGLEYLCYAILKPFGLELDIRFCRLIIAALGILASGFGALAVRRLAREHVSAGRTRLYFFASWGLIWLVLSKNFLADIDHPDNLHACHALLVFWLCLLAVETRRFGTGMLTMVVAGLGVFTKQTEALSFAGPALVFAIYHPWGWRRWFLLLAIGAMTAAVSLHVLWLPPYARFWTFDLLRHEGVWVTKSYKLATELFSMDRGVLLCLALLAVPCLWSLRNGPRRYLTVWFCVGLFTAAPNVTAFLKSLGVWNNLIIFEIWIILIVWPFFGMLVDSLAHRQPVTPATGGGSWQPHLLPMAVCGLMLVFVLLLVPLKIPPREGDYAFARRVENAVRTDIQAGRKVLIPFSTEFLIRSGVKEPPRDRANSIGELLLGNCAAKSGMESRIKSHYYDRIYMLRADWYGDDLLKAIDRNYAADNIITGSPYKARDINGYGDVMSGCVVLSPRP